MRISDWSSDVCSSDLGRYTWDKIASCSVNLPFDTTPSQSFDGCQNIPSAANTKASFEKFTWAMGLDYQLSGDVFLYGVTRRGYRAGGINTPNLGGILVPLQNFGQQKVTDYELVLKAERAIGTDKGRNTIHAYIHK